LRLICKVDGLCEPAYDGGPGNPGGVATYGFFICDEKERPIAKDSGLVGEGEGMDHMVAEYEAVLQALSYLLRGERTKESVEIQNDNQQLVLEMTGGRQVETGRHESRHYEAKKLTLQFARIHYKQVSGELNWAADCLAWKEYRRFLSERRSPI
jgi:ribonuclease HI